MQHRPLPGTPGVPRPARPRHPDFGPGRFLWGDGIAVALYVLLFGLGGAGLLLFVPGFREMFGTPDTAQFAVNLVAYAVLFTVAMIMAFPTFVASLRTFLVHPWAKGFGLPAAWLASLGVTAAILVAVGQAVKSENQLTIEGMTRSVPFATMFAVAVVMGPFVEEYLFRHLLIGKLSRHINVWVCVVLSVGIFSGIHFLGAGGRVDPTSVVPYAVLGVAISVAYVLAGKSLAYSYILHVLQNGVSLVVTYTVLPLLG